MNPTRFGVAFRTLGCKVNQAESEDIAAQLLGRGLPIVPEDEASVVVVNTCTVTGEADAKGRKAVRQALRAAGRPVVIATGCMAAISASELEALDGRVVVEANKSDVADRVADALWPGAAPDSRSEWRVPGPLPAGSSRTRATVKIEDGCDSRCSYCVVPQARGAPASVSLNRIVERVSLLAGRGVREVVLTGVNLGRYRDAGCSLGDVIEAVAATGVERIRLSSIEVGDLTAELLGTLSSTPSVCPHLHVPLQSGSDRVLSRMVRPYTRAAYAEAVLRARRALPGLALTTDVIAGFPGETDEDASASLAFCREIGFAKLHVFRFSERTGTPAADMSKQVPAEIRASRAAALRGLSAELERSFAESHVGGTAEVLVERVAEGPGDRSVAEGTARDHLKVAVACSTRPAVGDVVTATITGGRTKPVTAVSLGDASPRETGAA